MRPFPYAVSLVLLLAPFHLAAQGLAVPTGFTATAAVQARSDILDAIFLGGIDGYLCALEASSGRCVARFRAGRDPIVLIACHPSKGELGIVESDGISRHRFQVFRYADASFEPILSESLAFRPEALCYSPKGGLLALAGRTARGIVLRETESYASLVAFTRDCGPATFVAIGGSEKSLLQYAPQGKLLYRSIPDGAVIQEAKAIANLLSPHLSADKKKLYGLSSGGLVALDALSGKTLYSLALGDIAAMSAPDPDGMALISLRDGRYRVMDIDARKAPSSFLSAPRPFVSVQAFSGGFSAIGDDGKVYVKRGDGGFAALQPEAFFAARFISGFDSGNGPGFLLHGEEDGYFIPLTNLTAGSDSLLPKTADHEALTVMTSAGKETEGIQGGLLKRFPKSGKGVDAFASHASSRYLAFASSSRPEVLVFSDFGTDPSIIALEGSSPVVRLSAGAHGAFAIQANGYLSRLDGGKAKRIASISGIQDAAALSPSRIAIGKVRGGGLASPLAFYSVDTGELSPSRLEAITVLRVFPIDRDRFFVICVEEREEGTFTAIREMDSSGAVLSLIDECPGEQFGTQVAYDDEGAYCYSFGADRGVTAIGPGVAGETIELSDFPVKLAMGERQLCALHADGSFSVVDRETGARNKYAVSAEGALLRLE